MLAKTATITICSQKTPRKEEKDDGGTLVLEIKTNVYRIILGDVVHRGVVHDYVIPCGVVLGDVLPGCVVPGDMVPGGEIPGDVVTCVVVYSGGVPGYLVPCGLVPVGVLCSGNFPEIMFQQEAVAVREQSKALDV